MPLHPLHLRLVDDDAIEISAEKEASRVFMQKCGKGKNI